MSHLSPRSVKESDIPLLHLGHLFLSSPLLSSPIPAPKLPTLHLLHLLLPHHCCMTKKNTKVQANPEAQSVHNKSSCLQGKFTTHKLVS